MAFFRNIMPNSVEGVSLPVDGSNSLAFHLNKQETTYSNDRTFLLSFAKVKLLETSGGCIIEFRDEGVDNILEAGKAFFDPDVIDKIVEQRAYVSRIALGAY